MAICFREEDNKNYPFYRFNSAIQILTGNLANKNKASARLRLWNCTWRMLPYGCSSWFRDILEYAQETIFKISW